MGRSLFNLRPTWRRERDSRLGRRARHRSCAFHAFHAKSSVCARRLLFPKKSFSFFGDPTLFPQGFVRSAVDPPTCAIPARGRARGWLVSPQIPFSAWHMKRGTGKSLFPFSWRRERDSNPRIHSCITRFRAVRNRPLCHLCIKAILFYMKSTKIATVFVYFFAFPRKFPHFDNVTLRQAQGDGFNPHSPAPLPKARVEPRRPYVIPTTNGRRNLALRDFSLRSK